MTDNYYKSEGAYTICKCFVSGEPLYLASHRKQPIADPVKSFAAAKKLVEKHKLK